MIKMDEQGVEELRNRIMELDEQSRSTLEDIPAMLNDLNKAMGGDGTCQVISCIRHKGSNAHHRSRRRQVRVVNNFAVICYGEDVCRRAAPDTSRRIYEGATHGAPGNTVVVEDGATIPRKDVC